MFDFTGIHSQETIQLANSYLHALAFAIIPWCPLIASLELVIGIGDMKLMMYTNITMVLLNILCSYLLIFGKLGLPSLGIAGAGAGMAVSYTLTFIGLLVALFNQAKYKPYLTQLFSFKKTIFISELLKTGIPMGIMYGFEIAFFLALTLFMGSYKSELIVSNQIVLQYGNIIFMAAFGIAQAITVRMGHLLGAQEEAQAKKVNQAGIFLTLIIMIAVALIYFFFSTQLISLDLNMNDPNNRNIIYYTKQFLLVCGIYQIFEGLRITFFGALRCFQDTKFTLIASIIGFWIIPFPIGYILAYHTSVGGVGMWWGMTLGAVINMGLLQWRYKQKINIKNHQSEDLSMKNFLA